MNVEEEELDCVQFVYHIIFICCAKACVEKGIHVFQEKPLALNTDEGLELAKLEEEHQECENLYLLSKSL